MSERSTFMPEVFRTTLSNPYLPSFLTDKGIGFGAAFGFFGNGFYAAIHQREYLGAALPSSAYCFIFLLSPYTPSAWRRKRSRSFHGFPRKGASTPDLQDSKALFLNSSSSFGYCRL